MNFLKALLKLIKGKRYYAKVSSVNNNGISYDIYRKDHIFIFRDDTCLTNYGNTLRLEDAKRILKVLNEE